jgi:hypothetical protein
LRPIKICIPIFFDDSAYPSAGDFRGRHLIYWRTIAVLCASIRRTKDYSLDIVICTNEAAPRDVAELLDLLDVSFASPSFSFRPPTGLYPAFSGAFYLFDSMEYCRVHFPNDGLFMFLDPDCLVLTNFESVRKQVNEWPLIGYELEIAEAERVNGCSRRDLLSFCRAMGNERMVAAPTYFGGEFVVVDGGQLGGLCEIVDRVWKQNLLNFQEGKVFLKTEEHVLSVAFAELAGRVGAAGAIVKRIWTRPSYRNISSQDEKLSLWHLPAEKRHAFQDLFNLIKTDLSKFMSMSDEKFLGLVGSLVRLELSLIERPLYFAYPTIKRLVNAVKGALHGLNQRLVLMLLY